MAEYKSMKAIAEAVAESGDLLVVSLGELREALNYDRLGVRVLGVIGESLAGEGLGYFPRDVLSKANAAPRYAQQVRVYKKGTTLGQVIEAVLDPTNQGDEYLKEIAGSDSANTLKKIRDLLAS